jgi:hypothetical protein
MAQVEYIWMRMNNIALIRASVVAAAVVTATGCTYAPPEDHASVVQVVSRGDSYEALVVVRHERFRRPTRLSAWPDGGKRRVLDQQSLQYLVHAESRSVTMLARQEAPDSLWESFGAGIRGLEGDSVAYIVLTGCPKGGECHPPLQQSIVLRLSKGGVMQRVKEVPAGAALPGTMAARREGERNYVRFGTNGDTVTARFTEGEANMPLFVVHSDGSLTGVPDQRLTPAPERD